MVAPRDRWTGTLSIGRRAAFVRAHRRLLTAVVLAASLLTCLAFCAAAGWGATSGRVTRLAWWFLPAMLLVHAVAYGGYLLAHHQVVNESGEVVIGWRRGAHVGLIGFGAWLIGGGLDVDRHALRRIGLDQAQAATVVMTLGLLEMTLLAPAACVCGFLLLGSDVSLSVTLPWVLGVPFGLVISLALLLNRRRRARPRGTRARQALDDLRGGIAALLALLSDGRRGPAAAAGIVVYWAADITALDMALHLAQVSPPVPRIVIAYATGYFLTRRTLPFAGVIATEAMLIISLAWVGVPLAAAAIAVLAYRLSDFALTLVAALRSSSSVERTMSFIVE